MNSKLLRLIWGVGGSLVANLAFATEYAVIYAHPNDLAERLNMGAKSGWELKSVSRWTAGCPNGVSECLVVVLKKD